MDITERRSPAVCASVLMHQDGTLNIELTGHCRRRKIRCLLAPDDTQNRCANCIRLKKDCSFFPVDQQPQMDRRPRASSRVDTRASNSSDSSPAMVGGHLLSHSEDFNSYPHLPLAVPYSARGAIGGELVSPMTRGGLTQAGAHVVLPMLTSSLVPINTQTFELPPQHNRSSWGSPFPGDGPTSAGHSSPGDSNHTYWGTHAESPMTPGFSPHLSAPTSALHSASDARSSFTSFAPSRTHSDSTWAMPTRSMSFGLVEDLPQSYQNNYHNPQPLPVEYRRRASEMHMHPPSLQTSNNSSLATPPPGHMTPLSAPPVSSPPIQHWGIPTTWSTLPSSLVTKAPDYGSWYGDTVPLAKVQEEDIAHFGSEPAILYAGEHH